MSMTRRSTLLLFISTAWRNWTTPPLISSWPHLFEPASREAQFETGQKQYGQLGNPTVWIDDQNSTRAEYLLAKPDSTGGTARHRFQVQQEQGRWWVGREIPLPAAPAFEPTLQLAIHDYVNQQAGAIWAGSTELLREEPFEGGQLLLFSYIEPHPAGRLTQERMALLSYYINGANGWQFSGGGTRGHTAGMNVADISLGLTSFGLNEQYVAYYGVVENANASSLFFTEPNGASHTLNLKGQKTILLLNERNPYEAVPFTNPVKAIQAKDTLGNTLRTNPDLSAPN